MHWTGPTGTMPLLLVTSDLRWMGPLDGKASIGKLQIGSEARRLRAIDEGLWYSLLWFLGSYCLETLRYIYAFIYCLAWETLICISMDYYNLSCLTCEVKVLS